MISSNDTFRLSSTDPGEAAMVFTIHIVASLFTILILISYELNYQRSNSRRTTGWSRHVFRVVTGVLRASRPRHFSSDEPPNVPTGSTFP